MTITHNTFTLERRLNATPARVFAAYATLEAKSAWFGAIADIDTLDRDFDFRVGGKERFHARWPDGRVSDFQAVYHDIVEAQRIILVYDMFLNGEKLSVSLQTLELRPDGDGTLLIHTEQGAYLVGGLEAAQGREHGTAWGLDNLTALIDGRSPEPLA
ncbi:SRPBCC domain-containing protein [Phenylobacterium sp.]|uniref:SRPBCC domain-containing protein n=1 Tax=Phenylobacterium sp. TaxID=1871053 RepID=UPI0040368951